MSQPTGFGGRDYPDFGISDTYRRTVQISDMSELAVRLGSINWFDRLGSQLFCEDFSHGIANWEHNSYPAGAFAVPSARYFATVPYSAKLITTTDAGSVSGLQRAFPFPYFSLFGVELHFKAISAFNVLYWQLYFYDGTYYKTVSVKVDYTNDQLLLYNSTPAYQKIDDLNIYMGANDPFNIVKVVADTTNAKYVRLMLNDRDYDVSDVLIRETPSPNEPYLYMLVLLQCTSGRSEKVWIDNIIFTIDEPSI